VRNYLVIGVFLVAKFFAQQPGYRHISEETGMPSNTVYNVAEALDGTILFGTQNGLVSFDGFYFHKIGKSNPKGNEVTNIQVGSNGVLWYSNFNHELFRIDKHLQVKRIRGVNASNFNGRGAFHLDAQQRVWFTSNNQLYSVEPGTDSVKHHFQNGKLIYSTNLSHQGHLFINSDSLRIYKVPQSSTHPIILWKEAKSAVAGYQPELIVDTVGKVAFMSIRHIYDLPEGLIAIDLAKYLNPSVYVNNFGVLNNGVIWVATSNGFLMMDWLGHSIHSDNLFVPGNNASQLFLDSKNNYWFATLDNGVFMASDFEIKNYNFYRTSGNINGVTTLKIIDNQLWLGTQNGDLYHSISDQAFSKIETGLNRSIYGIGKIDHYLFVNNQVIDPNSAAKNKKVDWLGAPRTIVQRRDWIYVANNIGIMAFPKTYLSNEQPNLEQEWLYKEISLNGELLKTDSIRFKYQLIDGRASRIFKDSKDRLWCITSAGVIFIEGEVITKIVFKENDEAVCMDVCEDELGIVYFFVPDKGIYTFREGYTRLFMPCGENGLPEYISRLISINKSLCFGSSDGVGVIDLESKNIKNYTVSDGLLSNVILDLVYYRNSIWCATYKGVSAIPIQFNPHNPIPPKLALHGVKVNGKEWPLDRFNGSRLNYDQNSVSFYFSAINFKSRDLLSYKYTLHGQTDEEIVIPGQTQNLNFYHLNPGNYTLEIKAFNDKGVISDKIILVEFSIIQAWYKTWWFWLGIVLVCILVLYFYLKRESYIQQRKIALENELNRSRLEALRARMNPHFMFNSLNSIQEFILSNDKKRANVYLGKFSDLMRMVLDMSGAKSISLYDELKALELYLELESLRFDQAFSYTIHVPSSIDTMEWEIPPMIIQPFIENAIKHGLFHKRGPKILTIHFEIENGELRVTIKDNGIGRKEANRLKQAKLKRHNSFATAAISQSLDLMNAERKGTVNILYNDLTDEFGQATGTSVLVIIPVQAKLN